MPDESPTLDDLISQILADHWKQMGALSRGSLISLPDRPPQVTRSPCFAYEVQIDGYVVRLEAPTLDDLMKLIDAAVARSSATSSSTSHLTNHARAD